MNYLISIVIVLVLAINGGLGGYHLYRMVRPRKMTWNARIYMEGRGKRKHAGKDGKQISSIMLHPLVHYANDIIERIALPNRQVVYRLQKLNMTVSEVTAGHIEKIGKTAWVDVLLKENQATLMEKYIDSVSNMLFIPIPRDRIETLSADLASRRERLITQRNVWKEIFSYVTIMVTLIMIGFITHSTAAANAESQENLLKMQELSGNQELKVAKSFDNSLKQFATAMQLIDAKRLENQNIIKTKEPITDINEIPSIENT